MQDEVDLILAEQLQDYVCASLKYPTRKEHFAFTCYYGIATIYIWIPVGHHRACLNTIAAGRGLSPQNGDISSKVQISHTDYQ